MMPTFRDISIRGKLICLLLMMTLLTLFAAGGVFIYRDIRYLKEEIVHDLVTHAAMTGKNTRAALVFNDPARAGAILESLKEDPQIETAALFDANGRLFAAYNPEEKRLPDISLLPKGEPLINDEGVGILQDVRLEKETVGHIYLRAHTRELNRHIRNYLLVAAGVFFGIFMLSLLLAFRLQRLVSQPILALADTARGISQKPDYSVRVQHESSDEVGALYKGFNAMLEQIERRERELNQYRAHLEDLVLQRTNELETAQKELMSKERLATLGQLTAMVSHEIRNPLGTIRNALYALAGLVRGKLSQADQPLDLAERNIARCDNIIEEMLDLTRIHDPSPEPTEVDAWLNEVLDDIAPKYADIALERRLDCGLEASIEREQFRRALINIVENAFQAVREKMEKSGQTSAAANRVTVAAHVSDGTLVVRVEDSGTGIAPEHRDKIFEPLFSTKGFGVGLGLTIVKRVMDMLGGDVQFDSQPSLGTKVTLRYPLPPPA